MPVTYSRTDDKDIFIETRTATKQVSMLKLQARLAVVDAEIAEMGGEAAVPVNATAKQQEAIEFYNMNQQMSISSLTTEKAALEKLIARLKALPVMVVK